MRPHSFALRFSLGLFGLLVAALPTVCQAFTLSGRVLYEDGRPADMVTVVLRNFTEMGFQQSNTDALGNFSFSVPRGVYYLNIRMSGFGEVNERVEVGVFASSGIMLYLRPMPGKERNARLAAPAAGTPVAAEYLQVPVNAREEYETGMKLYQRESKLDEGLLHLRKAAELHPKFALAHYGMGMLLMDLDRMEEARDSLLQAISENEKMVPAYFPLGAIFNQHKEFSDAEKILRRGIGVKEDIWQLHFELARAVGYQSRWEEAEKSARRAAELNATAPKVRLLLANIYFEMGKDDLALAEAEEFLKLAPDDPIAPQIRTQVEAMRKAKSPPSNPL